MVVTALIAIITPSMTYLFTKVEQGMAADEMHTQLQKLNEATFLRVHDRLLTSRRFFQNDSSGVSFLGRMVRGASAPPTLVNSHLAKVQNNSGSFSPVTATSGDFGNSMFFVGYDTPTTINNLGYNAPVTVKGGTVNYGASNGSGPATIIIDVYRFYYFYLTATSSPVSLVKGSFSLPLYRLVEWRSVQFADFYQLDGMTDGTLKTNVVTWLATAANFPGSAPVTLAWDHTQTDPALAFYSLDTAGNINFQGSQNINEASWANISKSSSGILTGGFNYGISGNVTGGGELPTEVKVPMYAAANSPYPGGFEVGLSGGSGIGKQVLFRSLLLAKGGSPRVVLNDNTSIVNIRDVW